MVRRRRQPRRLPVHVRPRAAVAQEPARQRRRRPDRRRRRRRPEPQLQRALELRQRGLVVDFSSETYRGPAPASEPETQAMQGLIDRVKPKFHRQLPLLRSARSCSRRVGRSAHPTPTTRSTSALGGTDANPAIAGFDPGISSDELYVTNGETTDYADANAGTMAFTPELERGLRRLRRSSSPTTRRLSRPSSRRRSPSTSRLPSRPTDPDDPVSPARHRRRSRSTSTRPSSIPRTAPLAMFDFTFDESYGDPQEVRVLAKRSLGARDAEVPDQRRARCSSAPTREWTGGERYGVGDANYYRVMRGLVTGTDPGDTVEVWFEGGGKKSDSFTYTGRVRERPPGARARRRGLHGRLARRRLRVRTTSPTTTDALKANGVAVRRLRRGCERAHKRPTRSACSATTRPSSGTRVTSHPARARLGPPATRPALAVEELFADPRVPQRGRARALHRQARRAPYPAAGNQLYDPFDNSQCVVAGELSPRCRPLYGSGDGVNDVLEYWFGAAIVNAGAGLDDERRRRTACSASTTRSRGCPGSSTAPTALGTRTTRVVHHDERAAPGRAVPAVRELGRGEGTTGPAGRSSRTRATTTCTRRSPTSRTSA